MIDNFTPQPYPLECQREGVQTWTLVIGWRLTPDRQLTPVIATGTGLETVTNPAGLWFRSADTRPAAQPARASVAVAPSRGPRPRATPA